ncbi:hypothetical protein FPV67DRAFT_1514125, partial [Lyophyllum atratum]
MTPTLPQELIDEIIGNLVVFPRKTHDSFLYYGKLGDNDYAAHEIMSLRSCSLVSSSFRDASQRQLFHSINLHAGRLTHIQSLLRTLSSNPTLASYIHSLCLSLNETRTAETRPLCDLLRTLEPHVHQLRLVHADTWTSYRELPMGTWNTIDPLLQLALLRLLRTPSCIGLALGPGGVRFPEALLSDLPHLQSLSLLTKDPFLTEQHPQAPTQHNQEQDPPGYLESLTLVPAQITPRILAALQDPGGSLSLSRLRYCNVVSQKGSSIHIQALLDTAAHHLQELSLTVHLSESIADPTDYLDLSRLTHLRLLRIRLLFAVAPGVEPGWWLVRVLGTLGPSVTELALSGRRSRALRTAASIDQWRGLDTMLTEEGRMPVLRRVVLFLNARSAKDNRVFLEERTPRLLERGIIKWEGNLMGI